MRCTKIWIYLSSFTIMLTYCSPKYWVSTFILCPIACWPMAAYFGLVLDILSSVSVSVSIFQFCPMLRPPLVQFNWGQCNQIYGTPVIKSAENKQTHPRPFLAPWAAIIDHPSSALNKFLIDLFVSISRSAVSEDPSWLTTDRLCRTVSPVRPNNTANDRTW